MGKITESGIRALYEYGKKVAQDKLPLMEAARQLNNEHPEVAISSAKHYINWYQKMKQGEALTWNSNSELLLYYAERMIQEEGPVVGARACRSVIKFGEHANREELIQAAHQLAAKYHLTLDPKEATPMENSPSSQPQDPKSVLDHIETFIFQQGFTYPNSTIANFYLSLKAKPFVILAGTSGTGKTRLVRLFAGAAGATEKNGRYRQVAVRPDWSDSADLLGHRNLNGDFVPGAITDFLVKAAGDLSHPYFLCLDEMNLARVEYYFSDLLSVMETRNLRNGQIVTDPISVDGYAGRLIFPENLYVIGTVNMDETTFPFSRKVLDRANTIEFSYVDLMSGLEEPEEGGKPLEPLDLENSFFRSDWLLLRQCLQSPENREFVEKWCGKLKELNEILQKADAHVGYRVRDEILFYLLYNKKGGLLTDSQAFDREILQKILPRIQGSSTAIRELLTELYKVCAGDYEEYQTDSGQIYRKMEKFRKDHKEQIPYPETAKKLIYMMRRYEEDGFTSYWL